jgi:hypothetical protein
MLERVKTVRALDRSATAIGETQDEFNFTCTHLNGVLYLPPVCVSGCLFLLSLLVTASVV